MDAGRNSNSHGSPRFHPYELGDGSVCVFDREGAVSRLGDAGRRMQQESLTSCILRVCRLRAYVRFHQRCN